MTVERLGVHGARADQFPAGLRVLAVDDDSTCLKVLECLLRSLQYNVTTTNQAILALNLLRENKDRFDLVISDVHMPDMDGFKLLELVGLEMDLPVIMLSGNSDPKVVMQGITHGACDYLLKPVREDVLKNIWQHVYRRRRFDALSSSSENHRDDMDRQQHGNSESGQHCGASLRHTGRKRKDQDEDDEGEEMEENMNENEDSSTQKKPRVVWSVELHRKFVTAVNQLGIEKAMPKRILDLMNVEKLTRENVASHLQKYRLYLKRISTVANQQANMVAALGGKDSQFLPMGSLDGARSYHSFPASAQLTTLASFQQGGMLGRLNSANNQALYGLGSSGMIQLGARAHNNNINNPPTIHDMGNFPHISFSSGAQQGNLIQGTPIPLERKLLIESAGSSTITQSNHYISTGNNFQILQVQQQQQQKQNNVFGSVPSERPTSSINPDIFDATTAVSSDPPDLGRCNETWGAAAPIAGYPSNILSHGANFNRDNGMNACAGDNLSAVVLSANRSRTNPPSSSASMGRDAQCANQCPINKFDSNILPPCENDDAMCGATRTDQPMQPNFRYCSSNAMLDMVIDDVGLGNGSSSSSMMVSGKLQGAFNSGGYNAFDELMTAIVKREREDILMDGDVGCDLFSLETCM